MDTVDQRLDKIEGQLTVLEKDVEVIKYEAAVTRGAANLLVEWTEKAASQIGIPL